MFYQLGNDVAYGRNGGDESGYSVALNGNGTIVAVGARQSYISANKPGYVRIYQYNSTNWVQLGSDIDGEAANDWSGYSVSLNDNGTVVAIGAPQNDNNGFDSGVVRVYQYNSTSWVQLGSDIDGEAAGDWSGSSVSLDSEGKRVAIGAPQNNGNGQYSGQVRVYEYNNSTDWKKIGSDIDGGAAGDRSGYSVSLSSNGAVVAIGAPYNKGTGTVRVYQYNSTSWVQLGSDIDGEAAGDISGSSVSLDSEGKRVAIGAPQNNGNGQYSGQVRVYEYNNSTDWKKIGSDIDGEAAYDQSGYSVSLNDNGTVVAIGAPYNKGTGTKTTGQVRVYEYASTAWEQISDDLDGEVDANFGNADVLGYSVALDSAGTVVAAGGIWHANVNGFVKVYASS